MPFPTLQIRGTARRLVVLGFVIGVFALDAVVPLGVNVPILYLVPLLLVFLAEPIRTRVMLTVLVSLLMAGNLAWAGKWNAYWLAGLWNRSFDLGVFVVALTLSIRDARTRRELQRAEARLRSQTAFAKIAEMAALVAHEVRNPLAGVRGALQVFGERRSLSSAERLLMQQMMDRMDVMDAHVRALLHYARPRPLQLQPIPMRPLLEDVARSLADTDRGREVRCAITGSEASVLGDHAMLREIFANLLVNAGEAQAGAGTIRVAIQEAGSALNVDITDAGPGIEPVMRERVFEPFFTTKPSGAGLGLAIVKQLVELHGGEVRIAASSSAGTTVRVSLPRVGESQREALTAAAAAF